MAPDRDLAERARRVKLLIMDCDGVLTDGRLYFTERGEQMKVFFVRDGQGLVDWHKAGGHSGIISGRKSPVLEMRATQLGVQYIFQGRKEKVSAFNELIAAAGVTAEEAAFIGDDTPDAEVMPFVGLAVAVGDAHEKVKAAAHWITPSAGGRGAVRDLIDLLLDHRDAA
ncbi:MAG: HAD hydrolase family protein [Acidobacteria bacterium]|nr:HAD hydrolase family protein [Acidobacteriota bacterium]